jgi:hypothetical protein
MNSDLTDGAASVDPANTGDAGIDQLFRILTAGPAAGELAGEQSALAMFRANISPQTSTASANGTSAFAHGAPALANGTSASDGTAPLPVVRRRATSHRRSIRHPFRGSVRWGVRLVVAGVIALSGGMAAAAYAAVLPAPVQDLAHRVLGFAGVPDAHHQHRAGPLRGPGHHGATSPGRSSTPPGRQSHSSQAAKPGSSARASGSPTPSSSAAAGTAVLSASAGSAVIEAGSQPVIDGQLTKSGSGITGVTVTLIERVAGQPWRVAGTGQTTSGGNVTITAPPLAANAAFQLRARGDVHSAIVLVTVTPQVTIVLTPGASDLRDLLAVTTQYAHRGNVVWLQVQSASGSWVDLRSKRLNAAGETWFVLSGKRLANKTVQVVLSATVRHGAATSNPVQVPPPS